MQPLFSKKMIFLALFNVYAGHGNDDRGGKEWYHRENQGGTMYGNTLVIANPAARSGKAAEVAAQAKAAFSELRSERGAIGCLTFRYTVGPKDATLIARENGPEYDTVVALGGDGLVNEVVNGIMQIDRVKRPALALIPCGNGDDFARTINMSRNPRESLQQFVSKALSASEIDVPCVNGTWYLETISFGLDAAIALGTAELRKKTHRTGTSLYLQCGIEQLVGNREVRHALLSFNDAEPFPIEFYLLAVQNGMSYGGGFKICPQARLDDGLLDICYAKPTLSAPAAIRLLLKAKNGKHINHPNLVFAQARHVHLSFKSAIPTQIDGEAFPDNEYDISLHPKQLRVFIPF